MNRWNVMSQVDRVAMEADLRVAGTRKFTKFPGDICSLKVTMNHKGPKEAVAVAWGVAPGSDTVYVYHGDQIRWLAGDKSNYKFVFNTGNDVNLISYSFTLSAPWPDGFYPEFADSYILIFGSRKGVIVDGWHDDIYGCPPPYFGSIQYEYS